MHLRLHTPAKYPINTTVLPILSTRSTPSPSPPSPSRNRVSFDSQKHHRQLRASLSHATSTRPKLVSHPAPVSHPAGAGCGRGGGDTASASADEGHGNRDYSSSEDDSTDNEEVPFSQWSTYLDRGKTSTSSLVPGTTGREGTSRGRAEPSSAQPPTIVVAGEHGRGEHVLVERRPSSSVPSNWGTPSGLRMYAFEAAAAAVSGGKRRGSPAPNGNSSLARHLHSYSPATSSSTSKTRRATPTYSHPPQPPPSPPPPLTFDSIQSTFHPFTLVSQHLSLHFRPHLIPEVILLSSALLFALYRLSTIPSDTPGFSSSLPLLLPIFSGLPFLIPFLALIRSSPSAYHKVPFTDSRGYRSPLAADDGVAAALGLPLLLASACLWDTFSSLSSYPNIIVGLEHTLPLPMLWEAAGIHAKPPPAPGTSPLDIATALIDSRGQLVILTALNAACLLLHLGLAKTLLRIERVPEGNTKRFFGFMAFAWGVSGLIWLGAGVWDWSVGSSCFFRCCHSLSL